jgi:hypothetical protein
MTDKEKLQKLFDAALKSSTDFSEGPPQRAFPTPSFEAKPAPIAAGFAARVETAPPSPPVAELPVAPPDAGEATGPATMAAVLDDAASTELAALLDEQLQRQSRKRKMEALVAALVLFGLTGGGFGWFVHSPQRVQAFHEAMREIRSVGDIQSMVAKYQAALDRIAVRGAQIDQATIAMGADPTSTSGDQYMEAEMKEMMGGEGTTVGQRNKALQKSFGHMAQQNGGALKPDVALRTEDSFE